MKTLSKDSFEKAKQWIEDNARSLEKALFRFQFSNDSPEQVIEALKSFQNSDGGFGNAIEPDLRTPHSSVLGTSLAFQVLRTLKADTNQGMVKTAVDFFLRNYNEKYQSWKIIPLEAENSPHAPWWNQVGREDNFEGFHLNPTAEILGYFYDYKKLVPEDLVSCLKLKVLDELSKLKEIEMHDFLCCKRLLESSNLDQTSKQKLQAELDRLVDFCILKDSSAWDGYGLRPIQVVDNPESPFMYKLQPLVEENLDFEIENQDLDGAWQPTWSWGDNYFGEWAKAKREWTGIITLDKLVILDRFGRIEE